MHSWFSRWRNSPHPRSQPDVRFTVDVVVQAGNRLLISGWRTHAQDITLFCDGSALSYECVGVWRPDVISAGFGDADAAAPLGFALVASAIPEGADLSLHWQCAKPVPKAGKLSLKPEALDHDLPLRYRSLGGALGLLLGHVQASAQRRIALLRDLPRAAAVAPLAAGHLDKVLVDPHGGLGLAAGWVHASSEQLVWLESDLGQMQTLEEAQWSWRDDVQTATRGLAGGGVDCRKAFALLLPTTQPGQTWRLQVLSGTGVHTLAQVTADALPAEPLAAYRRLTEFGAPPGDWAQRAGTLEQPIIAPMLAAWCEALQTLPVTAQFCGGQVVAPQVSLIIPLYGRLDLIEPQLMKFRADAWLCQHAQIIYVVDDPSLVDPLRAQSSVWFQLYGVPFEWVWGGANRGFAGANNLGVDRARAPTLLFVNSDVFPIEPGWAQALTQVLAEHPGIGAVAPRLLHADGSIQHAGMTFERNVGLGIWVNQHPGKGLDPALDPSRGLTIVPAVTGACIAVRKGDLADAGGWETGYLAGDFEDSDLCLTLRRLGMQIAYLPEVELVHLERQSFVGLGDDAFRNRLVVFNAQRHQQRWGETMASQVSSNAQARA